MMKVRTWWMGAAVAAQATANAAMAATALSPVSGPMAGFTPDHAKAQRALEATFDAAIDPAEMKA